MKSPTKIDATQTELIYKHVIANGAIKEPYVGLCNFLKVCYSQIAEK